MPQTTTSPAGEPPFRSANSPGFPDVLMSLGITLLVTTYQAGKLMAIRGREGKVSTLLRSFERPMGLAIRAPGQLALGTRHQVWVFRDAPDIAVQLSPTGTFDGCFLPRVSYVTGDIRGHEMAWVDDELWMVNTFFSCLCSATADASFLPRWHPSFLDGPSPGDHCHLNGLACVEGRPRYVTALGESTTPEGWRENKAYGGILIDIASGEIVSRGLSMPHSPRWHRGRLWFLESGRGELRTLDLKTAQTTCIARFPGYARGLAFAGDFAFIGLSRVRESSTFGQLPITELGKDLKCGIWIIELQSGRIVELMQFQAGVEEIFAVEVLNGYRNPEIVGFHEETVHGAFVVPRTGTR